MISTMKASGVGALSETDSAIISGSSKWRVDELEALSPLIEEDAILAYRIQFPQSERSDKALKVRHARIHYGQGPRFVKETVDAVKPVIPLPTSPVSSDHIKSGSPLRHDERAFINDFNGDLSQLHQYYMAGFPESERSAKAVSTVHRRLRAGILKLVDPAPAPATVPADDSAEDTDADVGIDDEKDAVLQVVQPEIVEEELVPAPTFMDTGVPDVHHIRITGGSKWLPEELDVLEKSESLHEALTIYDISFPLSERTIKSVRLQHGRLRKGWKSGSPQPKPVAVAVIPPDTEASIESVDVRDVQDIVDSVSAVEPVISPDEDVDYGDDLPLKIVARSVWHPSELDIINKATSRQNAVDLYREAFPDSGRNDKSIGVCYYRFHVTREMKVPEKPTIPAIKSRDSTEKIPWDIEELQVIPDNILSKILVSRSPKDAASSCRYLCQEAGINPSVIEYAYAKTKDVIKIGKEVLTVIGRGKIVQIDRQISRCLVDCKDAGKIWTSPLKILYGYMYGALTESLNKSLTESPSPSV